MKKTLILFLIAAALIIVMSTGSLAIYTQTQTLRGQLYTRVFLFKANEQNTSYDLGLSGLALMPGEAERELYRFELSNIDGASTVCDYNMNVTIKSHGMSGALTAMDGLVFRLYNVTSERSTPAATVSGGELSFSDILFPAKARQMVQYRLTAQWQDTGSREAQTALASSGAAYSISLTVSASAGD